MTLLITRQAVVLVKQDLEGARREILAPGAVHVGLHRLTAQDSPQQRHALSNPDSAASRPRIMGNSSA